MTPAARLVLEPGSIGPVTTRNRLVRAGTSESMAGPGGEVTDELVTLYENLARGGAGLIFTGHFYCHPRGRYGRRQVGIDSDDRVAGLSRVTEAVHRHGGLVFAQIAHAGSQTLMPDIEPLAPSAHPNVMTGREVLDASRGEIDDVIESFRDAARRAAEAGFDGVHIHGANGYLISEFRSPISNRREDQWGGSAETRERFPIAVVEAVRGPREVVDVARVWVEVVLELQAQDLCLLIRMRLLVDAQRLDPSVASQTAKTTFASKPNGTYVYRAELVNSHGVTVSKTTKVVVKNAAPGKPVVSTDNHDQDSSFVATANLWWGTNATSYVFKLDSEVVGEGTLTANTPNAQTAQVSLQGVAPGDHTLTVMFSNANGSTESRPITVKVR